jgi:hypothetical protein
VRIDHDRSCSRLIDAVREQEFRGVVGNPVRVGPGRGAVRPVDEDVPLIEPHRQHRQRPEPAERRGQHLHIVGGVAQRCGVVAGGTA